MRVAAFVLCFCATVSVAAAQEKSLKDKLQSADLKALTPEQAKETVEKFRESFLALRRDVNDRSTKDWRAIQNKADWEKFRDDKIALLRQSLGQFPPEPNSVSVTVTKKISGDGFVIENIVYQTRPNFYVTANLYSPAKPTGSMPGIIVIHSHHNPKTQSELQDMGMTWARAGCLVLVPDQIGHGERRTHPFTAESKYPKEGFKPSRQDYYFRYNTSLQLFLIGDSLMGWMAWDMMRGVDLLLSKQGIDKNRIIILGSVAGGGDPSAVTGALDKRITVVGPFNFGGPQPETRFPLPDDAELAFNYLGGGSWESTRSLAFTGRDGALPLVIVGSYAPRGLIYGHEFAWDADRDPVWKRLQKIYSFYEQQPPPLISPHGSGSVKGKPPESTHCNNIGAVHRKPIHPFLEKFYKIPAPNPEYRNPISSTELQCWTEEAVKTLQPKPLQDVARFEAVKRMEAARASKMNEQQLKAAWNRLLGIGAVEFKVGDFAKKPAIGNVEVITFTVGDKFPMPVTLLKPKTKGPGPTVVCLAHEGKEGFLKHRGDAIARLLEAGVTVCLPDLPGTGEAVYDKGRGRTSGSTSISALSLMFGKPLLGIRLESVLALLRQLEDKEKPSRVALWGDSFAPVNPSDRDLGVPLELSQPPQAEPAGGLLALLAALNNKNVPVVYVRGGLAGYRTVLESPYVFVPHDVIVPGALTLGDLNDVTAALNSRWVRLEGLVDGQNRRVEQKHLDETYANAMEAFRGPKGSLTLNSEPAAPETVAAWMIEQLTR